MQIISLEEKNYSKLLLSEVCYSEFLWSKKKNINFLIEDSVIEQLRQVRKFTSGKVLLYEKKKPPPFLICQEYYLTLSNGFEKKIL